MRLNGRSRARLLSAAAIFGLSFLAAPHAAHAQGAPDVGNPPYKYNKVFPFWGKKLAARGLTFPLPFGFGLNYAYVKQGVDITGVNIKVNDGEYRDISKIVKFDHVTSNVMVMTGRLDLWVLPFLNVYGLGTYAMDSDTDVLLSQPFPIRAGAAQTGYGGGFGVTGAFSFWGFFGVVDANWGWTKMQKLDAPVRTALLTPRVGKRFALGRGVYISSWVGAMRQKITANTEGAISLSDAIGGAPDSFDAKVGKWAMASGGAGIADGRGLIPRAPGGSGDTIIHYKLDKALTDPWNLLIGSEIDLHKRVQMRMEFGFLGRTQLIMGINYRFGGFETSDD